MRRIRLILLAAALLLIGGVAVWTRGAPAATTVAPVPSLTPSVTPVTSASPDPSQTPAASVTPVASATPVAPGATAGARFAAPQTLSTSAPRLNGPPIVAVDARGRSLVAWVGAVTKRGGRIVVRRGDSRGRFGARQTLSGRSAILPSAALAADGTAVVVWQRFLAHGVRRLEAATARPGHRFGSVQRLTSTHTAGGVAVATAGRLVVLWAQSSHGGSIRYAITGANGRFGSARAIAAATVSGGVSATTDAAGDVIAALETPLSGSANAQAAVVVLPAGATRFGAPQVVSADTAQSLPGSEATSPRLFAGPGGVALGYGVEGVLPWRLQVAAGAAGGGFGAPQTATEIGNSSGTTSFSGPDVALPEAGAAVAIWSQTQSRTAEDPTVTSGVVEAAGQQPDGTFGAPQQLSTAGEIAQGDLAAVTAGATAIALWGDGSLLRPRLRYATALAGAGFTAPVTLAATADRGFTAAAAGDHAIVAWSAGKSVRVARLTAGAAPAP